MNSNETNFIIGHWCAFKGPAPLVLPVDSLWSLQRQLHSSRSLPQRFPCMAGGSFLWQHWWQILSWGYVSWEAFSPTGPSTQKLWGECWQNVGWGLLSSGQGEFLFRVCVGPLGGERPGPWCVLASLAGTQSCLYFVVCIPCSCIQPQLLLFL